MADETSGHDDKTVLIRQTPTGDQKTILHDQQDTLKQTNALTGTEKTVPQGQDVLGDLGISEPKPISPLPQEVPEAQDTSDKTRILYPGAPAEAPQNKEKLESAMQKSKDIYDPVVGWLVVIDGPGKGGFCPIFYGNNSIGRNSDQRIALDFGDTAISAEEQAYLQYNHKKREFLFVPNLAKPNIVEVNEDNLANPGLLKRFDKIRMGETTLLFVPLCDEHFEWGDLSE